MWGRTLLQNVQIYLDNRWFDTTNLTGSEEEQMEL